MNVQLSAAEVKQAMGFMRGKALRIAFLVAALAGSFTGYAVGEADTAATQTTLSVSTSNDGARTKVTLQAHVVASSGVETPAGVVTFRSSSAGSSAADIGSAVVGSDGSATVTTNNLAPGSHRVVAVYQGDVTHSQSISASQDVTAQATAAAGFTVTASPTSLTTPAGGSVTSIITVTAQNGFSGNVTLSCSGMPIGTNCIFSPSNVVATCTTASNGTQTCTPAFSSMQIQTYATGGGNAELERHAALPVYAFVAPALFGLLGLGTTKSRALKNTTLALFLFAGVMSLTACSQRYNYLNHGPTPNAGTAAGVYTVTINAVSAIGSSITTPPTSPQLTLTVQ